jgi:hypothetical protein
MERMDNSEVLPEQLEDDNEITFEKRFGWYVVLNRVTDNKIKEHDEVLGKKVVEVLNQLLYLIEYDKEQVKQQKKAMGKI